MYSGRVKIIQHKPDPCWGKQIGLQDRQNQDSPLVEVRGRGVQNLTFTRHCNVTCTLIDSLLGPHGLYGSSTVRWMNKTADSTIADSTTAFSEGLLSNVK